MPRGLCSCRVVAPVLLQRAFSGSDPVRSGSSRHRQAARLSAAAAEEECDEADTEAVAAAGLAALCNPCKVEGELQQHEDGYDGYDDDWHRDQQSVQQWQEQEGYSKQPHHDYDLTRTRDQRKGHKHTRAHSKHVVVYQRRGQQNSDSSGYSRGDDGAAAKPKQKRSRGGGGGGSGAAKGGRAPSKEVDPDTAAALTALTLLAHDGEGVRRFISSSAQESDRSAAHLGDREEVRAARGPQAASRCIGVTWRERIQRWEVSRE